MVRIEGLTMSDPAGPHIVKTFHEAIDKLDKGEPIIRDLIETNLMDVAGVNKTKVSDAMLSRDELTKQIVAHRVHHIKTAFRHLRDHLPTDLEEPTEDGNPPKLKIHGHGLATWARTIAMNDAERIKSALSVGLTAGEDNTDIAHRIIGSRRMNGVNGATEVTRQHVLRLGRGLLHKRKSRMGEASPDVRAE